PGTLTGAKLRVRPGVAHRAVALFRASGVTAFPIADHLHSDIAHAVSPGEGAELLRRSETADQGGCDVRVAVHEALGARDRRRQPRLLAVGLREVEGFAVNGATDVERERNEVLTGFHLPARRGLATAWSDKVDWDALAVESPKIDQS